MQCVVCHSFYWLMQLCLSAISVDSTTQISSRLLLVDAPLFLANDSRCFPIGSCQHCYYSQPGDWLILTKFIFCIGLECVYICYSSSCIFVLVRFILFCLRYRGWLVYQVIAPSVTFPASVIFTGSHD